MKITLHKENLQSIYIFRPLSDRNYAAAIELETGSTKHREEFSGKCIVEVLEKVNKFIKDLD